MIARWRKFMVGQGNARAGFVGLIQGIYTPVGNVSTGEDDLMSYSIPANALFANGQALRITAYGTTADNANNKTVKLKLGGSTLYTSGTTSQNKNWIVRAIVMRKTTAVQRGMLEAVYNDTLVVPTRIALTLDETGALIAKCTGEATATDDIVQEGMLIEALTVGIGN